MFYHRLRDSSHNILYSVFYSTSNIFFLFYRKIKNDTNGLFHHYYRKNNLYPSRVTYFYKFSVMYLFVRLDETRTKQSIGKEFFCYRYEYFHLVLIFIVSRSYILLSFIRFTQI